MLNWIFCDSWIFSDTWDWILSDTWKHLCANELEMLNKIISNEWQYLKLFISQSAGAVEYTDCKTPPQRVSWICH